MARNALQALDDLEILGVDSLIFISDHADDRAPGGSERSNGFTNTGRAAVEAVFGLEIAMEAPVATPVEPDLPSLPSTGPFLSFEIGGALGTPGGNGTDGSMITLIDAVFAARGGDKGKPPKDDPPDDPVDPPVDPGGVVLDEYRSGDGDDIGYDIWIDFKGSDWSRPLQQAFIDAADYFTTVITDDIGGGGRYRGKTIDDLYVTAELKAIDGTGGILGQAGPTAVWTATELTAVGQMQFDVADAITFFDKGLWDDIVTHELMHVLGFGTLWEFGSNDLVSDTFEYTGSAGNLAYDGEGDIPVEEGGSPGTAGGHWEEAALKNELMTGYINDDENATTNNDNYLSEFSVMSLADLGYVVEYQDYPYDEGLLA
jgi:hypothetical protein